MLASDTMLLSKRKEKSLVHGAAISPRSIRSRNTAPVGGLFTYGANIWRHSSGPPTYPDRLLKGEKVGKSARSAGDAFQIDLQKTASESLGKRPRGDFFAPTTRSNEWATVAIRKRYCLLQRICRLMTQSGRLMLKTTCRSAPFQSARFPRDDVLLRRRAVSCDRVAGTWLARRPRTTSGAAPCWSASPVIIQPRQQRQTGRLRARF